MNKHISSMEFDKTNTKNAYVISIITTLLMSVAILLFYNIQRDIVIQKYKEEQRVDVDITEVFFLEKVSEMVYNIDEIKRNISVKNYMSDMSSTSFKKDVEEYFYSSAVKMKGLTQIRILDSKGTERVRVNNDKGVVEIVADNLLQDKSGRYYFSDAISMKDDEVYMSDFDLNIENNQVIIPYEPTIRFSVNLLDDKNNLLGILVINVDGFMFFDIINRYEQIGGELKEIGVLDENNYWSLSHKKKEDFEEIKLIMKDEKLDATSIILKQYFDDHDLEDLLIDGNYYYVNQINFGNQPIYEMKDGLIKWYVIGNFNVSKVLEAEGFFMGHPILVIIAFMVSMSYIMFRFITFYQIKSNNKILLLASKYVSDNSREGIVILDSDKRVIYCNKVFEIIFSYQEIEIINRKIDSFLMGELKLNLEGQREKVYDSNLWNWRKDGHLVKKHLVVKAIRNRRDKTMFYIGIFSNPTLDSSMSSNVVIERVYKGEIRDIKNNILLQQINEKITLEGYYTISVVKFYGSLIKLFENDQLLHGQFFTHFEKGLKNYFEKCLIAIPRMDTLILINQRSHDDGNHRELNNTLMMNEIIVHLERLIKSIKHKMSLEEVDVTCQIGNAQKSHADESIEEVYAHAVIALEVLIKFSDKKYLIYNHKFVDFLVEDKMLREHLMNAFLNNEFFVVYHPQIDIDTGQIVGFEALVRWNNRELGLVLPDKFIPILEEDHQILKLGRYVIDRVRDTFMNSANNLSGFRVSINLSAQEYLNDDTLDYIIEAAEEMKKYDVQICVEITETTLVENLENAKIQTDKLHEKGIEVSIDDFGTGYSSFGYLKNLNADELKIDRMFIFDYPGDDNGSLIKAIIEIGSKLGMKNIVEGVETEEQLNFLSEIGNLIYQGFISTKPLKVNELIEFIKEYQSDS